VRCSPIYPESIVADEAEWRVPRRTFATASSTSKVIATRWRAVSERTLEFGAETTADCHVVKIVLRTLNIRFSVSGRTVQDGVTTPGMVHVTEPAVPARCLFRGPYDVLHMHIPNALIAECARDMAGHPAQVLCSANVPCKDMTVESLGRALLEASHMGGSFGQLYADCINIAIVARLVSSANRMTACPRPKVAELARWRLKRALDYVEARLDKPVSLADVASSAGLTRMHFATQFRAATGMRPHDFVLRRRIDRAQELLRDPKLALVDVALSVGFQTQAHFTTVFKRFAGETPHRWRRLAPGLHGPEHAVALQPAIESGDTVMHQDD